MKRAAPWLAIALGLVVFARGIREYYPFLCDDALISLRYSQRLLEGKGLSWTDGPPVEGYSNLLWVLACAALGFVGMDLVLAVRVLGIAGMAVTIVIATWAVVRRGGGLPAALYVAGALGLSGSIQIWAIGGLEQAFVAPLLALGVALTWELLEEHQPTALHALGAGLPFGLLALTRPDGPLFAAVIVPTSVGLRLLERRSPWRFLLLLVPTLALGSAQLLFRVAYYHDVVPNTAHAKLEASLRDGVLGRVYVEVGLGQHGSLLVFALAALATSLRDVRARRCTLVALIPLYAWLAYVVRIGGDIFPANRHHVPSVVLLVLAGGGFLSTATPRLEARLERVVREPWSGRVARALVGSAVVAVLARFGLRDQVNASNDNARTERFEWTCKRTAEAMRGAYGRLAPLAAVDPAGCFPYWSKFPSIDMVGLNDRVIATRQTENAVRYPLAHQRGDAAYVLDQRPDIVVLCSPNGSHLGCWPSGVGMTGTPSFHRDYRLVSYEIGPGLGGQKPVTFDYWIRMASGPLGVRSEPERIAVPAHFFTASRSRVVFDEHGRPAVRGSPDAPFRIAELRVPAGRWRVSVESSGPIGDVRVYRAAAVEPISNAPHFELDAEDDVDVEIAPSADTLLYAMTLERS